MSGSAPVSYFNVEVSLPYGGDFTLTAQGDLQLSIDTIDSADATLERIQRIIMTSPTLTDLNGTPIARADDLFNPRSGGGVRRAVGSLITNDLINRIASGILLALSADPGIALNPPPVVNVSDGGGGRLLVGPIQVTTISGQVVTAPSFALQVFGV